MVGRKRTEASAPTAPGQPSPLSPAVFHVLLSLSEGPLHGYGVMRSAEETSGLVLGPGTVYGALARLAEAGWVEPDSTAADDTTASRRRGRSFRLTESGEAALGAEARRLTRLAGLDQVRRLASAPGGQGQ